MRTLIGVVAALLILPVVALAEGKEKKAGPALAFTMKDIDGKAVDLAKYQGKVVMMVNVASKCGLTPQYEGLERLQARFGGRGFTVLGFPANEFGAQEPGTNAEIQEFCRTTFGVQFPMFEKIVVKGEGIHPLYQTLTQAQPNANDGGDTGFAEKMAGYGITKAQPQDVFWNFEKFLVDRQGKVVARFAPSVTPDHPDFVRAIESALG